MKTTCLLFAIVMVSGVYAQQGEKAGFHRKPTAPKVAASGKPVTATEARLTFIKQRQAVARGFHTKLDLAVSIPSGNRAVTRDEVIHEMWRFYRSSRGLVKLTPRPIAFDASVLKVGSKATLPELKALVRLGFVAKIGPLAVGPKNSIAIPDFGDSVGYFIARLAQVTHQPNKWSPTLGAGN